MGPAGVEGTEEAAYSRSSSQVGCSYWSQKAWTARTGRESALFLQHHGQRPGGQQGAAGAGPGGAGPSLQRGKEGLGFWGPSGASPSPGTEKSRCRLQAPSLSLCWSRARWPRPRLDRFRGEVTTGQPRPGFPLPYLNFAPSQVRRG